MVQLVSTDVDGNDQPIKNITQYVPNEFLIMEMVNDLQPGNSFILESIIRGEKNLFYVMRSKKMNNFYKYKKEREGEVQRTGERVKEKERGTVKGRKGER